MATSKANSKEKEQLVYGKVPPQSNELERAVLGAIMLEKSAFDIAYDIIKPKCFYSFGNEIIFQAMVDLSNKGYPIDLLTVVEELKRKGKLDDVGGAYYVSSLTNHVVSGANVERHSKIVLEKFILRELAAIGNKISNKAFEHGTDVFDLLDDAEKELFAVSFKNIKSDYARVDKGIIEFINKVEKLRHQDTHIVGISSGFKELDRVMAGWQAPDFTVVAARPSVGKTALALRFARNAYVSEKQTRVGFFSMEMSRAQLIQRLVSAESEINLGKIIRGKLDDEEMVVLTAGADKVMKMGIYIDDTPALNVYELRAKARRMKERDGVGMIIIDYLQLMAGMEKRRADNREQEISKISRDLKELCKELNMPIIALSQLSRDVERRGGGKGIKMPILSDLRDSGSIEQDADNVLFIYRPDYYDININEQGESNFGETHIKIGKHRNGALETIKLMAKLSIQTFVDFDDEKVAKPKDWKPVKTDVTFTGNDFKNKAANDDVKDDNYNLET